MTITKLQLCAFAAAAAVALTPPAVARQDVREAFANAPDIVLPLIPKSVRLDMLDYYNSGLKTTSDNRFEEPTRIDTITADHLVARVSDVSRVDFSIVPLTRTDSGVVIIKTIDIPAPTSFVSVYDQNWVEMPAVLPQTRLADWTLPMDDDMMVDIENAVPFIPTKMVYDPASRTLMATHTLDRLLTADDYAKYKQYFRPMLQYRWTGKQFKLQKP